MCAPEIRALTSIGGSLAKYGARGVDLANLVFEPSANRGFAIQIDFCRPSGARCARSLLSWLAGLGRRQSPIDSNQYWPARPGTHASAARPAVSGTARISRPPCSPALQLRNLRDPDPPATGSQPRCPQTEAWYALTQSALALRYTGAVATSSVGGGRFSHRAEIHPSRSPPARRDTLSSSSDRLKPWPANSEQAHLGFSRTLISCASCSSREESTKRIEMLAIWSIATWMPAREGSAPPRTSLTLRARWPSESSAIACSSATIAAQSSCGPAGTGGVVGATATGGWVCGVGSGTVSRGVLA